MLQAVLGGLHDVGASARVRVSRVERSGDPEPLDWLIHVTPGELGGAAIQLHVDFGVLDVTVGEGIRLTFPTFWRR